MSSAKSGCVDPTDAKKPASGLVPYGVNAALWSDGAQKDRWVAIPDGKNITVSDTDGDFDFPNGTVLMKTFTVAGKRTETRLFMRHDDGGWNGYTYEWLDDGSDAVLLPAGKTKTVGAQTWTFPSRSDCVGCHSEAAGRSLGLEQMEDRPHLRRIDLPGERLRHREHVAHHALPSEGYRDPHAGHREAHHADRDRVREHAAHRQRHRDLGV